jgi:hypothetical protein
MENEKVKTEAGAVKVYVKPTVTKHEAASLVVGSCSCTQYSANYGSGSVFCGSYANGTNTYYH